MQAHVGVFVDEFSDDPRIGRFDIDAEFFLQFARQGLHRRFARFDLASREFPVTCVDAAGGTATKEESSVAAEDYGGGDVNDLLQDRLRLLPMDMLARFPVSFGAIFFRASPMGITFGQSPAGITLGA